MENKILFVDDDGDILRVYRALALHRGYVPFCALSGAEALEIMMNNRIHVFCLDLLMPSMDGFELCRRIKERDAFTCVYAVSGYVEGHNPDELQQAGFDGFFGKPVRWELLFNACQAAFEKINQAEKQISAVGGREMPPDISRSDPPANADTSSKRLDGEGSVGSQENGGGIATAISTEVLKKVTWPAARFCPYGCSCTDKKQCGEHPLCEVSADYEVNMLCLSSKAPEACPYAIAFGTRSFCCCPRHYAIYKRAGY